MLAKKNNPHLQVYFSIPLLPAYGFFHARNMIAFLFRFHYSIEHFFFCMDTILYSCVHFNISMGFIIDIVDSRSRSIADR